MNNDIKQNVDDKSKKKQLSTFEHLIAMILGFSVAHWFGLSGLVVSCLAYFLSEKIYKSKLSIMLKFNLIFFTIIFTIILYLIVVVVLNRTVN